MIKNNMSSFNLEDFTRRLIAETLFHDEEYGVIGNLGLIDPQTRKERFLASYVPNDDTFIVEEATEWEDFIPEEGGTDEIGYVLAVDSKEYGCFDSPEETSETLLNLAREHNLLPSVILLFEEDEVT